MTYEPIKEDRARGVLVYSYEDDDGNPCTHDFPTTTEVCGRCGGRGVHDPEGFGDVTDLVREDRDWAEDYMRGRFDVRCTTCDGKNVVLSIDVEKADEKMLQHYYDWCDMEQASRAESEAERRMGC